MTADPDNIGPQRVVAYAVLAWLLIAAGVGIALAVWL